MRLRLDLISLNREDCLIKVFRSMEDGINIASCAVGSSSCAGVVRYLSLIDHPSSEPRHLLWSTIPVGPSGMPALFPVLGRGRNTSHFGLERQHMLLPQTIHTSENIELVYVQLDYEIRVRMWVSMLTSATGKYGRSGRRH